LGLKGLQLEHNETRSIFCSLGCPTISAPHEDERVYIARPGLTDCIEPPSIGYVALAESASLSKCQLLPSDKWQNLLGNL
jgi:hypothetical protein